MKLSKITLCLSAVFALHSAYAENLNAGALSREAQEKQAVQPLQKIAEIPPLADQKDENDPTPLAVNALQFEGNQLVSNEALQQLVQQAGEITTLGQLRGVMNKVGEFYQTKGYPLVLVSLPPQKVVDGVVKVQITESRIADIALQNQSRLSDEVVNRYLALGVPKGQTLYQPTSERTLLLMRDLAGTNQINYSLSAGENAGESLLGVELQPANLLSGSVSVDNYGGKSTGEWRTRANLYLNSPFKRGERFSLQAMSSFKGINYANLGAELPLGYHGLMLATNVSHTKYELGNRFKALDASGTSSTASASLRYPLLRSNQHNVWLSAGGEFNRLRDKMGATNSITTKNIRSGNLGLNGSFEDAFLAGGYTQFSLTNTFGRLNITSQEARALDAASAKTGGGYYKFNANLSRTQYLTQKLSLTLGVVAQWANKNLDSGEQFSFGGADSAAAYRSGDFSVDKGVLGQAELRYMFNPYFGVLGFYDTARGSLRAKPYLNEQNKLIVHGGGVGVDVRYKQFALQSKVGWHSASNRPNNDRNPNIWVKASYSF